MILKRFVFYGLIVFGLCSCAHPTTRLPSIAHHSIKHTRATQASYSRSYKRDQDKRVGTIFYNLSKNTGTELCDRKLKPSVGIDFGAYTPYKPFIFSDPLLKEEDNDQQLIMPFRMPTIYVRFVVPGSAADKAGVKQGDKVVSMYGVPTPIGQDIREKFLEIIERNQNKGEMPVDIEVERGGKNYSYMISPDMICPYSVFINRRMAEVNAYADGESVFVSETLLDFMTDDNDLAAVLAHELAHNTMGHVNSKKTNINIALILGGLSDIFIGTANAGQNAAVYASLAYSKEFELEADYVSAYYMARASYDYKKMKSVQKRLAGRHYSSLYIDSESHPTPQVRYLILEETANQIEMKKAFNDDLRPDFKEPNQYLRNKKD